MIKNLEVNVGAFSAKKIFLKKKILLDSIFPTKLTEFVPFIFIISQYCPTVKWILPDWLCLPNKLGGGGAAAPSPTWYAHEFRWSILLAKLVFWTVTLSYSRLQHLYKWGGGGGGVINFFSILWGSLQHWDHQKRRRVMRFLYMT